MQISSSNQLAMQILKLYGLVQMPLDNQYWSGAIFVKKGKKIPVINTALPRANQYFTAWHEIYHLIYDSAFHIPLHLCTLTPKEYIKHL